MVSPTNGMVHETIHINEHSTTVIERLNAISREAYTRENVLVTQERINRGLQWEIGMRDCINMARLFATAVRQYISEKSIIDITLRRFLDTQIESFTESLFSDFVFDTRVERDGIVIMSNDDVKELVLYEFAAKFKVIGKLASAYMRHSESVTIMEFLSDATVEEFARFAVEFGTMFDFGGVMTRVMQKYRDSRGA